MNNTVVPNYKDVQFFRDLLSQCTEIELQNLFQAMDEKGIENPSLRTTLDIMTGRAEMYERKYSDSFNEAKELKQIIADIRTVIDPPKDKPKLKKNNEKTY